MFEVNLLAVAGEAAGGAIFDWPYVGKHTINLAVLLVALFYVLKKPVTEFLKARRRGMSEKFDESGRKLDEAKKLFEECSAKLAGVKSEIGSMKSSIAEQAETERRNILRHADEEKEGILRDVAEGVKFELAKARAEIRKEAVSAIMRIAERNLRDSAGNKHSASVESFESLVGEGKWPRLSN